MKKLSNIHPGEVLLKEYLAPMGLSQNALARAAGVSPRRINEIVLGKRSISADTALRLARVFGVSERAPVERHEIYLGDEPFVSKMQAQLADSTPDEIPAAQRRAPPKSLDAYERAHRQRDVAIATAYREGGHTMKAIGEHFGLHYSMVSRIVRAAACHD